MTVIALCSKEIDFLSEIVYTIRMDGAFIYIGGTLLMNSEKTIRDPMYGYITIESPFAQLIDTEEFQRLRNIRQTGYQSLYPSALHNRFVHSLGVFYLGKKALEYFEKNINIQDEPFADWDEIRRTFLTACLLHDVGHSPFSHTGEDYYVKGCDFEEEYAKMMHRPDDWKNWIPINANESKVKCFFVDLSQSKDGTGKSHEAMSTLLGIELCRCYHVQIDEDLFIRAIIGLKYQEDFHSSDKRQVVKNAMISLLNGNLLDVDKLDYVLRDAYVTGYNSLTLDLERLLAGYTIVETVDYTYEVAFKKGALSVIENVIYANDLERRWIQNHPAILYDCWLIDGLLGKFDTAAKEEFVKVELIEGAEEPQFLPIPTIYTKEALSSRGISNGTCKLRLLCDDDIICYAKNIDNSFFSKQYFARHLRYKPLWKTEASFDHLTNGVFGDKLLVEISKSLQRLIGLGETSNGILINSSFVSGLKDQLKKANENHIKSDSYQQALDICNIFSAFQKEERLKDFEFVVLFTRKFQTAYRKTGDLDNMKIELETGLVPLNDVISVQAKGASQSSKLDLFYVYTTAQNIGNRVDIGKRFIDCLRRNYRSSL